MRIALVGPAHPYKGGGARHTTELAHRLAAAGHDVIIESWRAQYPSRLYPGQQLLDVPEGEPYPRAYRRLAWYRPDGWFAAGRRLRSADLVVHPLHFANDTILIFVTGMILASMALLADLIVRSRADP